jgi:hypothetical protein
MSRIPAIGLDPDEYEPRGRARSSVSRPGRSKRKQVDFAYDFARMHVDLDRMTVPGRISSLGGGYFPPWAMRRAYMALVKEGILRGPEPVPKRKEREPIWYHLHVGGRESSEWVAWAEGAWRSNPSYLSHKYLRRRANRMKADIRRSNKRLDRDLRVAKEVKVRAKFLPVQKPVPLESQRARVERFYRSLEKVEWDGMVFFPVPGPAMDALKAWRDEQHASARAHAEERRECPRCGGSFLRASWVGKKAHSLDECNFLVVTRIMTE